ncbi:MAG: hypothetical protein HGA45_16095 [Chloroflexales bacterium]|nr:hypothetical protein [Chloroflexales bacterium]
MPLRQDYLLTTAVLSADRSTLDALQDIAGYAPHNPEHEVAALREREAALRQAELNTERARLAYEAARELQIQAGWDFHNPILGARAAVVAQFGPDSLAVSAIGLKRKSDRKRLVRRRSSAAA